MNILFWCEQFYPEINGVTVVGMNLISSLKGRGFDFTVITSQGRDSREPVSSINDTMILRYPFYDCLIKKDFSEMGSILKDIKHRIEIFKPDLIHIHSSEPSMFFYEQIARQLQIPVIITVHLTSFCHCDKNGMMGRVLKDSDCITTVSESAKKDVLEFMPELNNRTRVIHNALPDPEIGDDSGIQEASDSHTVFFAGRLSHGKGVDVLVKAFSAVKIRHSHARLIIAGDGSEKEKLVYQVEALGLVNSVDFIGPISVQNVYKEMGKAAVVVVPSREKESFGLSALLGALAEKPVVASNIGGLPEIVRHNETGFLVESENVNNFIDRISYLLENPETASDMGKKAAEFARKCFCYDDWVNTYEQIYHQLGERKKCVISR